MNKNKKLQVFISSTFTDLRQERQAAVEAVLEAGHIPAGMELFTAGDESQLETIKRWIDESDVLMLLLGGRYGSIEEKSGKSYIHLEYEYAKKNGKPFFAIVMNDDFLDTKVKSPDGGREFIETKNGSKYEEFKTKVKSNMCSFFSNLDQLKLRINNSLRVIDVDGKLHGWIHGSQVVDPKTVLEKVERVEKENEELRKRVEALPKVDQTSAEYFVGLLTKEAKELLIIASEEAPGILLKSLGKITIYSEKEGHTIIRIPKDQSIWHKRHVSGVKYLSQESSLGHEEDAKYDFALENLVQLKLMHVVDKPGTHTKYRLKHLGYQVAKYLTDNTPNPPSS